MAKKSQKTEETLIVKEETIKTNGETPIVKEEKIVTKKEKPKKKTLVGVLGEDLTLYAKEGCAGCSKLANLLTTHNVKFKRVTTDKEIMEVQKKYRISTTPFLLSKDGKLNTTTSIEATINYLKEV